MKRNKHGPEKDLFICHKESSSEFSKVHPALNSPHSGRTCLSGDVSELRITRVPTHHTRAREAQPSSLTTCPLPAVPAHGRGWKEMVFKILPTQTILWLYEMNEWGEREKWSGLCIWQPAVKSEPCSDSVLGHHVCFLCGLLTGQGGELTLCSSGHVGTNPSSANMEMKWKFKFKGTICFLPLESLQKYWTYKKWIQSINKDRRAHLSNSCEMLPSKVLRVQLYWQRMPARTKDQEHRYTNL